MRVARPVLNGEVAETGLRVPRRDLTQLLQGHQCVAAHSHGLSIPTGEVEKRFVLRQYTVFNAAQLDGVAVPEITVLAHRFTPIERCAQLVDAMPHRPAILHGHQRAFYTPATDTLHLPSPGSFQSPEAYYATLWHEVTQNADTRIMPR